MNKFFTLILLAITSYSQSKEDKIDELLKKLHDGIEKTYLSKKYSVYKPHDAAAKFWEVMKNKKWFKTSMLNGNVDEVGKPVIIKLSYDIENFYKKGDFLWLLKVRGERNEEVSAWVSPLTGKVLIFSAPWLIVSDAGKAKDKIAKDKKIPVKDKK